MFPGWTGEVRDRLLDMVARRGLGAALVMVALMAALVGLVLTPRAVAAFPGENGKLAFELTGYELPGSCLGGGGCNAVSDGVLDLAVPVKQPRALLSCSGGVGNDATGSYSNFGCRAGGDCPDATNATSTLCLDDGRPSFSADGKMIAFANDTCQGSFCRRIAIVGAHGAGEMLLPALTADDSQPAFLLNRQMVFTGRASPKALQNLYTVAPTGTGLSQLTTTGGSEPAPCADGSIAFVHSGDVYLLSADRSSQRRLTFRGGASPDCSPNGRWIAFRRGPHLYTISRSGKPLRKLTSNGVVTGAPSFSPNGQLIAFASRHRPSKAWPPRPGDGYNYLGNSYLQVIGLHGRGQHKRVYLGQSGSNVEQYIFRTFVGGISWQPLPPRVKQRH